jgi:hypothetical protein
VVTVSRPKRREARAKRDPIDSLKESYKLLVEVMENPQKQGYVSLMKKIRFGSKIPMNMKLFDFKEEIDADIKDMKRRILRKLGMDTIPDGLKE